MYSSEVRELKTLADSLLFQQLTRSPDGQVRALASTVETVAKDAAHLLGTVVVDMPLYTLHNETHVLNVIGWMESLLQEEAIKELSPLEWALCILAAYTHDLGMTLSAEERAAMPNHPEYLRFRDRYVEERHLIENLRKARDFARANLLENHIRTEYLRRTHSDSLANRMRTRLHEIAPDLVYCGFDFRRHLELVAISHNQPVEWLRRQFEKEKLSSHEAVGHNEHVNFLLTGVLLRLGDIMDFDASRTPSILFQHIGLDRELGDRFEKISGEEWKKHLAITGVEWSPYRANLTYRAANCPHPAVEKSIREFVDMIRNEVSQASSELRGEDRFRLSLPDVKADVKPKRENGKPVYTYHDWHFRLDQEEIIRLLMGESLYGDPGLCIREILQNALDAVELRDLRLQFRARDGKPAEPVDGEPAEPGHFIYLGKKEALEVRLSWGEDNGHQFIRVEDNGTGMTAEIIERYFTQIGKSFYRSPDFRSEQSDMRRHGLIATPISRFGIGVLSCFMSSDRISVRTHPGQTNENRQAIDLEISGPGSLFWTKPGTRLRQGTEVTLWLRKELSGTPVRLGHDRQECLAELQQHFGYSNAILILSEHLDPGVIAAKHIVWPKYPVQVKPPGEEPWTIDERFHIDHLAPIDEHRFRQKVDEWGCSDKLQVVPRWGLLEWFDDKGEEATGSRVRIWFPAAGAKETLKYWELFSFVEPQVHQKKPLLTVQGVHVKYNDAIRFEMPFEAGAGFRAWFDLRGDAVPGLTVDRSTAFVPSSEDWHEHIAGVWQRCIQDFKERSAEIVLWNNWRSCLAEPLQQSLLAPLRASELVRSSLDPSWLLALAASLVKQELLLSRHETLLDLPQRILTRAKELARDLVLSQHDLLGLVSVQAFFDDLSLAVAPDFSPAHVRDAFLCTEWLQDAFFPTLEESWPALGLRGLRGRVGDAVLTAPAAFGFDTDGRTVLPSPQAATEPHELHAYGYDLCFPLTAIPLGSLGQQFPAWRADWRYRPLGVLPFLFPNCRSVWQDHYHYLLGLFPLGEIYAFRPAQELWYKPFHEWTSDDWKHPEHRSLFWDIAEGIVLAAPGVQKRDSMPLIGKPFEEF